MVHATPPSPPYSQAALELVRDFYDRVKILASYLVALGVDIRRTTEQYNKVVGSVESRLLPAARKLKEMGLGGEEIGIVESLDVQPRALSAEELSSPQPPVGEA